MTAPEIRPGLHSGSTTLKNVSRGEARRLAATSSGRVPIASMACCTGCTMKGSEYSTEARTSPANVKGSTPSPSACVHCPTVPCGPMSTSR